MIKGKNSNNNGNIDCKLKTYNKKHDQELQDDGSMKWDT